MFSVKGTKRSGKTADPMFQETKANDRYGNRLLSMFQTPDIWLDAEPYAPAGIPVKIELQALSASRRRSRYESRKAAYMKHVVRVASHLYDRFQLKLQVVRHGEE